MEAFHYHVFVCDQKKPEGVPGCCAHGGAEMLEALRREILARGLEDEVQVTTCGSLGLCDWGPNMIVYPEGVWYTGIGAEDVPEIVKSHFEENAPVERFVRSDAAAVRAEILANRAKRLAALRGQ
ncbi:MAG TPA: (2Fe-2S) ferredoxin domain-containing protein [Bryobacteraceae bacterium]|nr:(2Fe-2S) ferredoxin domain-containing protein [Bryobacteraceae bacterium]